MPGAAQLGEQYGDPSSLAQCENQASALLRTPLEIWLQIYGGKIELADLMQLRSISKTFWLVSERLMPHVARQMNPKHADDSRIDDPFFAEALIAAHRLNVRNPFEVMVARDGSLDPPSEEAHATPPNASSGPSGDASVTLPSRAQWIIGSRRLLHDLHMLGRSWMFRVCESCKIGACSSCRIQSNKIDRPISAWWFKTPERIAVSKHYSNAIMAYDAQFCARCMATASECPPQSQLGTDTITLE